MSRIMNEIYAEARAAREAVARERERRARRPEGRLHRHIQLPEMKGLKQLNGREDSDLTKQVAMRAIKSMKHPCTLSVHVDWWSRKLLSMVKSCLTPNVM